MTIEKNRRVTDIYFQQIEENISKLESKVDMILAYIHPLDSNKKGISTRIQLLELKVKTMWSWLIAVITSLTIVIIYDFF